MDKERVAFLVVDDDDNNCYMLKRQLGQMGYENVTLASGGQEAKDLLGTREFDLVLLDNMMPEVSGIDVLEYLRNELELAELPVIMVSALTEIDSVVACIELGAEDYVPKPINRTLLRARIEATLQKKALRDTVNQQLAVIRRVFGQYVPEHVVASIVSGGGHLEPTKTVATILYADVEQFTTIAESLEPEQLVQMLNEYFPAMIAEIDRFSGSVNQFQGDALLVTFNVPIADPQHADHALHAAHAMQQVVAAQTFAGVPLKIRIGICTGEVIAGNVGSGERMNYTVHGDAVNLAARLEQLNKVRKTSVLVAASTVASATEDHLLTSLGMFEVRGKSDPVEVYSLST